MAWTQFFKRLIRVKVDDVVIEVKSRGTAKLTVKADPDRKIERLDKKNSKDNNSQ